jgi:PAS domain S-box-containing protein
MVSLSIVLQLLSVFVALRLMASRGNRAVGALMLLAASLVSFRRFVSLRRMIAGAEIKTDVLSEIAGCIISFLLLAGFLYLSRLIASHRREINERRRTEEERRGTNANLQALIQAMPDAVFFKDVLGRYTMVNRAFAERFGADRNMFIGKTDEDLMPPAVADSCRKNDDRSMKDGGPLRVEDTMTGGDGEKILLDGLKAPIYDSHGNLLGIVGVNRDVTERSRAEDEIERLSHRNEMILESAGEGICGVNLDGIITFANPAAARMTGWTVDDLIGKSQHDILHHSRPDGTPYPREECKIYAPLRDGVVHRITDELFWRRDGTSFPVEYISTPIRENGAVVGAVVVFKDIAERRQIEEALKTAVVKAKEEKAKTDAIVAAIGDGISIQDIKYKILYQNEVAQDLLGEHVGEHCYKAYQNKDQVCERCHLTMAFTDGKVHKLEQERTTDRGTFHYEIKASPLRDASGTIVAGIELIRDITERKAAEEALRRSEAMLQMIIDTEPECVKLLDSEARLIMMNRAGLEMIEVESLEQVKGQCVGQMITSDYREAFMELTRNVFQGRPGSLLFEMAGAKGTRRWLDTHAVPFRNEKDEIVALLGVTRDVTDRKQAESALKKTNAQLQTLIHAIPDMVVFKDVAGRHVIVNKAVEEVTGHSKDEILGKTIEDLLPPGPAAACRKSDEEAMQRSVPTCARERIVREDGKETYFDMVKAPMIDPEGNVIGLVAIGRDITERHKMEEALRRSEANYRALLEQASDGIAVIDRQGRYLDVNSRMCDMMGYSREEFLRLTIKNVVASEDQTATPLRLSDLLAGKTVISERVMRRKDGSTFPMEISAKMIPDGRLCGIHRDITERKKAEEALRAAMLKANEEKTKSEAIISAIGDFMVILDREFKVVYQNKVAVDNVGDRIGEICHKAFEDRDAVCEGCPVALSFGDGLVHRGERTAESVRGTMHLDITASPLKDASGRVTAVIEMVKDITERRRAETLIRESEEKYKNLVELTTDIIYLSDGEGNQVFMNDEAFKVLEYSPRDVIGKPWSMLIHPEDREASFKAFAAMKERNIDTFNFENRYVTKSGKAINALHNVRILRNEQGEIVGTQGIARDITQRKQVEDRLKLYSQAMEEATDGVQIVDLEGRIVYSNKALEEMFGYGAGELTGKHVNEMSIEREFPGRVIIPEIMRTGRWSGEIMNVRKDGSQFPIWLSTALVKNERGAPIAMVGIIRDITERRRAEAALRTAHIELEVLVQERTAELRMINEQLSMFSSYLQEAREKERTSIAREIHDELGQALTALKMDLSWLRKRLPKNQKSLLVKEESMSELVESTIQTVKKISAELRPGILDHLGLTAAIEWQADDFQKRTGIRCRVSIVPEEIVPDRDRSTVIFRIFQETLTNIVRHAKATKVSVKLEQEDAGLVLEVKDNGRGITEEQLSDPKSLGLMGIRERAAYCGGKVIINGTRNRGTTVTVHIPLHPTGGVS